MMCAGKEFGCLVPYPDNCSLFLVCDCIYPTVKLCPAQLWWDNKTQGCNYPQNTKCIYYTFTSTEATPTTTTNKPEDNTTLTTSNWSSTTEENWPTSSYDPPPAPPGISETFCRKYPDGSVHRYPYDCNAYISCRNGCTNLAYCITNKLFNPLLHICDTPNSVNCKPEPYPTTTTTTTQGSTVDTSTTIIPSTTVATTTPMSLSSIYLNYFICQWFLFNEYIY